MLCCWRSVLDSNVGGIQPLNTRGFGLLGWNITAAQPLGIVEDGVTVESSLSRCWHLSLRSPS